MLNPLTPALRARSPADAGLAGSIRTRQRGRGSALRAISPTLERRAGRRGWFRRMRVHQGAQRPRGRERPRCAHEAPLTRGWRGASARASEGAAAPFVPSARRLSVGRGGGAGSAACACIRARHARADVNARAERTKPRWRGAASTACASPNVRARQRPSCHQPDASASGGAAGLARSVRIPQRAGAAAPVVPSARRLWRLSIYSAIPR